MLSSDYHIGFQRKWILFTRVLAMGLFSYRKHCGENEYRLVARVLLGVSAITMDKARLNPMLLCKPPTATCLCLAPVITNFRLLIYRQMYA